MAIEQAVDEMQIAWTAASGADSQVAGHVRLAAGGEGGDLLVPHMQPLNLALATNSVAQAIQTIANNAVNALDPRRCEDVCKLISNRSRHNCALQHAASRERWLFAPSPSGKNSYDAVNRCSDCKLVVSGRGA